jgi:hypothetical protein
MVGTIGCMPCRKGVTDGATDMDLLVSLFDFRLEHLAVL